MYVFTPTITAEHSDWYRGTADALYQNLDFLKRSHEPYWPPATGSISWITIRCWNTTSKRRLISQWSARICRRMWM